MKKLIAIFILISAFFIILMGIFTIIYFHRERIVDESRTVYVKKTENGFQLYRNGSPFFIRGASGNSHLKELAEAGGNTFRVYDTTNLVNVLNEAQKYNLAVIVDIPFPKYNNDYHSFKNKDLNWKLIQDIKDMVKKYRNHPALLMWSLGNELYYPSVFWTNSFINTFNEAIDIIHNLDPNHPVYTSFAADFNRNNIASIYIHSPDLDLISINVFGSLKWSRYLLNKRILLIFGIKPYFISEWGTDGPWERELTSWQAPIELSSAKKVEQIISRYKLIKEIKDGACLGSLFFFWGEKQECTHTWFSLFREDRYKSEIFNVLKYIWKGKKYNAFGIDNMLLDDKDAFDNIILSPRKVVNSKLLFTDLRNDSLKIEWEIYPESWNSNEYSDEKRNVKIPNLFLRFCLHDATFTAPAKEGPYRIFAYIYDKQGNFATTNTPFYVLSPK
jgi:hypothetical protein